MRFVKSYKNLIIILFLYLFSGCRAKDELVSLVKYNGKFGFINTKGKWFIEPNFDSLDVFYNGIATSYKNDLQGAINAKGRLIIDHKYEFIGNFENERTLIIVHDSVNYITLRGKMISQGHFKDGYDFSEDLAPVQFVEDGKWGYINKSGNLTIDTSFDHAEEFKNGIAGVRVKRNEFIINKTGQIIDTFRYTRNGSKFELIGNSDLRTLGKVNSSGDTIMQMQYKSFGYPQGHLFWFNNGERYGLADTTGAIIVKPEFEYISYFSENGLALAMKNSKYGFIDKSGRVIIDFKYDEAQSFKYDLAPVSLNGKWGFINSKDEIIIQSKFEKVLSEFRWIYGKFQPMYITNEE